MAGAAGLNGGFAQEIGFQMALDFGGDGEGEVDVRPFAPSHARRAQHAGQVAERKRLLSRRTRAHHARGDGAQTQIDARADREGQGRRLCRAAEGDHGHLRREHARSRLKSRG